MAEKAPYKLTVKLDGVKPEHIAAALEELRERAAEYDQTGEASATMTIEAHQEAPLVSVMEAFETWLFYRGKVDCEMTIKRPGLRPETRELLAREKSRTPMDTYLRNEATPGERAMEWLVDRETVGSDTPPRGRTSS
jgi:hypothetical protein